MNASLCQAVDPFMCAAGRPRWGLGDADRAGAAFMEETPRR
ncbi:hypothetical protein SAMN05443248_0032 [Bradyrhizobium erythrophlei]|uniref:Uncharacterized protein n=1 Tax=Bradyrhizobium erythrophlei TaxID=1437360 RepID=A0A1M5GH33_9BRAD|nr:hypothetical protein SAMN05443248_0032 [Bradyrhizobium erythrophlei]